MLINRLCNGPDFEKVLKRRLYIGFGLLAVGLTGVACYFLLLDGSQVLPDFARGFYLGGACGFCLGAVFLMIRSLYLLSHPEAQKKAKIQAQDEREKAIVDQSFQFAGTFTFFASAAALFVLVAVDLAAALAVLGVMAVYAITWLVRMLYLSKAL